MQNTAKRLRWKKNFISTQRFWHFVHLIDRGYTKNNLVRTIKFK